jgi:hypothetical protein
MPRTELAPGITVTSQWVGDDYRLTVEVDKQLLSGVCFMPTTSKAMQVAAACDAEGQGTRTAKLVVFPGESKTVLYTPEPGAEVNSFSCSTTWHSVDLPASRLDPVLAENKDRILKELAASVKAGLSKDSLPVADVAKMSRTSSTFFTDDEFRPGPHLQVVEDQSKTLWKRVRDIFGAKTPRVLGGISPKDISQGKLGNCWLLSAISCLAERPERVLKLFSGVQVDGDGVPDVPLSSIFEVTLFHMCLPRRLRIDDYFPCAISSGEPMYAKNTKDALWVMVCEKAFAKMYGSYRALQSGRSCEAFQDLTGCPVQLRSFSDVRPGTAKADELWKDFVQYCKDDFLLALSTAGKDIWSQRGETPPSENPGLVTGHAYALLRATELKSGERLVQIRNPWGDFEWKGKWSDSSSVWTPEIERELGITTSERVCEDGMFWMAYDDLLRHFFRVSLCDTRPYHLLHWKSSFITDPGKRCQQTIRAPAFELEFRASGEQRVWVGLHQEDARGLGQCEIDLGLTIFRIDGAHPTMITQVLPRVIRDRWHLVNFSGPATLVVFASSRGQIFEKLRTGETMDESEEDTHVPEVVGLFDDAAGVIAPSLELRSALMNIFWRVDRDLDGSLSESECSDFLARCPSAKGMSASEMLSSFDHTEQGLTKDGFVAACMAIAEKRTEAMTVLLAEFGYNEQLRLVYERPFVLTVHASLEKPGLLLWPADRSHARSYTCSFSPKRPSHVIDPFKEEHSAASASHVIGPLKEEHLAASASLSKGAAAFAAAVSAAGKAAIPTVVTTAAVPPFPSGFHSLRDREPEKVSLKVGDLVRLRPSLGNLVFGWGRSRHGEVGRIRSVGSERVVVDFASHSGFRCAPFEVQQAQWLEIGDVVRVKASIKEPEFGWGSVRPGDTGVVLEVSDQANQARIRFGRHGWFLAKVDELEWVLDESDPVQFSKNDCVRLATNCLHPREGEGRAQRGQMGVITEVQDDGDLVIDWPTHKGWFGHPSDVEPLQRFRVGDHVELLNSVGSHDKGTVGVILFEDRKHSSFVVHCGPDGIVSASCSSWSRTSKELPDQDILHLCGIVPGMMVRFQSESFARSQGLDNDQVGIVTKAVFDESDKVWNLTVCFPGDPKWTGPVSHVRVVSRRACKGDYVVLTPTLQAPALGWGEHGPVKHGTVGRVKEVTEAEYKGGKHRALRVEFGGDSYLLLSGEVVISPVMP